MASKIDTISVSWGGGISTPKHEISPFKNSLSGHMGYCLSSQAENSDISSQHVVRCGQCELRSCQLAFFLNEILII